MNKKIIKGDIWTGKTTKQNYQIAKISGEDVWIKNISTGQVYKSSRVSLLTNYKFKGSGKE